MPFTTVNSGGFRFTPRTGSYIIGYLVLIERSIKLMSYVRLSDVTSSLMKIRHMSMLREMLGIPPMHLCFDILLLCFEILLVVALLKGLDKCFSFISWLWFKATTAKWPKTKEEETLLTRKNL